MSFIYFLILIGVLIFVHELGHFVVARFFDVKVYRFSIGFGPALLKWRGKETEYTVSILPLGGYVQMADGEMDGHEIPEEDQHRTLMSKPIWQRSLIVLAGPAANIILPVMIYFLFGMMQTTTWPAVIGQVFPDSPAAEAGLQAGDRLVSINGKPIQYWHQTVFEIHPAGEQELAIEYERDGERFTTIARPEPVTSTDFLGLHTRTVSRIGITAAPHSTVIALRDRDGPAARAGLRSFDKIVAINGEPVDRYDELKSLVRLSEGETVTLRVLRPSQVQADFAGIHLRRPLTIEVTPELVDGIYALGIDPSDLYIAATHLDGAASRAGLLPGDKIVAIDGVPHGNWALVNERIENTVNALIVARDAAGEDHPIEPTFELTVHRGDEVLTISYSPDVVAYQDETTQTLYRVANGWESFRNSVAPDEVPHRLGTRVAYSSRMGVEQTWEFTQMMVVGIVRLVQGRITLKSVGGPIMIGELAAEAGRAGYEPFLRMMALISINLAIVNLLPIPILDGGRLVFFALEALKRGPLSARTRQIASYVGLVLILMLMLLAFKNDIERNWYRVVEYFEER